MNSPEYLNQNIQFPEYLKPYIENPSELINVNESIFGLRTRIEEQKNDAESKSRTLLIITGLSGGGKDSTIRKLLETDSRFGWVKTCTTRTTIRPDEVECDPYIRITQEQFDEVEKSNDFIEGNRYSGGSYCSLNSKFEEIFQNFEIPVFRPDPSGTVFYSEKWRQNELFFKDFNLITVFIVTPSLEILEERLRNRPGTDEKEVIKRLEQFYKDVPYINGSQYIAINENNQLEKMVQNIRKLFSS